MSNKDLAKSILKIEDYLKEILIWLKLSNLRGIREILAQELNSDEKKKVYELTDGKKSQKEIAELTGISPRMVSYYWQKWHGLGILVEGEQKMRKIVTLDEVGISSIIGSKQAKEPEVEFKPEDFRKILSNPDFFPNIEDLFTLARDVLLFKPEDFLDQQSRDRIIDDIIDRFRKSDRFNQALFIQALERRTVEKKDTQFKKFFESWEKQIRG